MWNCCCHHNRFSGNTPIAASKSKRGPLFENLYCYEVFSCHFSQPQFFVKSAHCGFHKQWWNRVRSMTPSSNAARTLVCRTLKPWPVSGPDQDGCTVVRHCRSAAVWISKLLWFEGRLEKNGFSLHRTASRSWSLDASWRNGETFNKRVSNMVVIKQSTINIRPCNAKLNPCSTLAEPLLRVQLLGSCLFVLDVLGSY